jgi:hypothetical protein
MILGFKERFKQSILDGNKIHTIRKDEFFDWFSNDGQIFRGKLIYWS